ncbi:hypothetical protein BDZ91DRAFT_793483 [Kalaharituber pfeilii]|nr:hypothetical protein BDZ91DRAFT_793483 [Kalaharituber pfeilii]
MGDLVGNNGDIWRTDEEKVKGLVQRNFKHQVTSNPPGPSNSPRGSNSPSVSELPAASNLSDETTPSDEVHKLPLEASKEDVLLIGEKTKKRADVERSKWLGVIYDSTLDFDHHWRSRVDEPPSGPFWAEELAVGDDQPSLMAEGLYWYGGAVALWGSGIGWRGQRKWREEFERLQYQALRKCTGAVQGAPREKVEAIGGVESVATILD